MNPTLYASFSDAALAEQAAGALLDHGARPEDLSLVLHPEAASRMGYETSPQHIGGSAVLYDTGAGHDGFDPLDQHTSLNSPRVAGAQELTMNPAQDDYSTAKPGPPEGNSHFEVRPPPDDDPYDAERAAKTGVTFTTPADAGAGAAKGAGVGLGLGAIAALAAIAVPGFGLIVGGGALATALAGVAGTTGAGAIAGGVTGYLKDQGVPSEAIPQVTEGYDRGGAVLALTVRENDIDMVTVDQLLHKYGAVKVGPYQAYMG